MGQGGGRVGRMLDTRQMFKNQEKLNGDKQGRGAMKSRRRGRQIKGETQAETDRKQRQIGRTSVSGRCLTTSSDEEV